MAACEEAFADTSRARHAVAANGGGPALKMVLKYLELQLGDQVISCALNFVGTHLPVIHQGGDLVLAEPDPATLDLDSADVEHASPAARARFSSPTGTVSQPICVRASTLPAPPPHPHHGLPVMIVDAALACGGTTPR
ncbi:DegT/DnrJ/EryC1/StrS family aminotransferase [Streptomyces sp. HMX112]|uniref:DegT/DnrJ/EryC1/StrS family aminotransferase n=1 Tax=Streptomyces sp. HMX112 TaxID=3390850 RepID=UPI003A805823